MTIPKGFWICDRHEEHRKYVYTSVTGVSTYAVITNGKSTRRVLHSFDDSPAHEFKSENSFIKEWYKFGHMHRANNNPAAITINDVTTSYLWYKHGALHNDSGPAELMFFKNPTGLSIKANWHSRGRLHNSNGPAVLLIQNDRILELDYFRNGSFHRTNGPAIYMDVSTSVQQPSGPGTIVQKWMRNGLLHRTDGPAITSNSAPVKFAINNRPLSDLEIIMLGYEHDGKSWVKI